MDLEDINPIAVIFGVVGAALGFFIVSRMSGAEFSVGIVWQILTPIVTGVACFFIGQKMSE